MFRLFLYRKTSLESFDFKPTLKYALRLFKLYIIWTLIYFPLSCRTFVLDEKGLLHAVAAYIRNCVFTGSQGHLWYLPATIFSVLLISILLYKGASPKKMFIAAFILYIIGLFAQSWFGVIAPMRELAPSLWSLLKIFQRIIVTTRDGLFEGFLFVCIGMLFAFYEFNISKKKALLGFIISMFLEAVLLKYFGFVKKTDIYLFLVPAAFFAFAFISQVKLKDSPIYKTLRILSSLIYYSHIWVKIVVGKMLKIIYEPLSESCLVFLFTLIISVIGSFVVIKLSEVKKFHFLKKLYT